MVIDEDYLDESTLVDKVHELYFTRQSFIDNMSKSGQQDSIKTIVDLIETTVEKYKPQ